MKKEEEIKDFVGFYESIYPASEIEGAFKSLLRLWINGDKKRYDFYKLAYIEWINKKIK